MQLLQKRLKTHEQFVEAFKGLATSAPEDNASVNKRVCIGEGINEKVEEKKAIAVEEHDSKVCRAQQQVQQQAPEGGCNSAKKQKHRAKASPSSSSRPAPEQSASAGELEGRTSSTAAASTEEAAGSAEGGGSRGKGKGKGGKKKGK